MTDCYNIYYQRVIRNCVDNAADTLRGEQTIVDHSAVRIDAEQA